MLPDSEIVKLCAAIYDNSSQWDKLWVGAEDDDIYAGVKDNILVFRGSVTPTDWFRDFVTFPYNHPQLGIIHAGFDEGMDEFFEEATKFLGPNPVVCGHSLGAARAWLFSGRLVVQGNIPSRVVTFGSPKPGCLQLANILAPVSKSSYRNGSDPVADVPLWIGESMAIEPIAFTPLNVEPTDWSEGLMSWHNVLLYQKGLND